MGYVILGIAPQELLRQPQRVLDRLLAESGERRSCRNLSYGIQSKIGVISTLLQLEDSPHVQPRSLEAPDSTQTS